MWAAITGTLKYIFKWLVTSVVGKAIIATTAKVAFLGFFLLAMGYASLLPHSPFRYAIIAIVPMINQIPYMRYLNAFIPFVEIIAVSAGWLTCIMIFHVFKVVFRKGGLI